MMEEKQLYLKKKIDFIWEYYPDEKWNSDDCQDDYKEGLCSLFGKYNFLYISECIS